MIEGRPDQGELVSTWFTIYEEFLDAMQDKAGVYKIKLLESINKLQYRHDFIVLCITRLRLSYSEEILNEVRKMIMVTGEFDPNEPDTYLKNLQIIINRLGNVRQQIEEKKAEYAVIDKSEDKDGTSEKQFDSLIAQIERFIQFHIDEEKTTVSRFCGHYAAMKEMAAAHEAAYNKHKR